MPPGQGSQGLGLGQGFAGVLGVQGDGVQPPLQFAAQGPACTLVPARLLQPAHLRGEVGAAQVVRLRLQQHACVDQRAPTHAIGHQGHHVIAHAHVEQALGLTSHLARGLLADAQVPGQVGHPGGEVPRTQLLAALQDAQPDGPVSAATVSHPAAGQCGGGGAAAVAGADDDHIPGLRAIAVRPGLGLVCPQRVQTAA